MDGSVIKMIATVEPIHPDEVGAYKAKIFPAFVIEAFNTLIATKYIDGRAKVYQNEVIDKMIEMCNMQIDRDMIFKNGWLNIEEMYRSAGWKVRYDKPAYNESYEAYFEFRRK